MVSYFKKYRFLGFTMALLSVIIITAFYFILKPQKVLPIYQPANVNTELVDSTLQFKKKYHTIADFSLINQNGESITEEHYKNKIYVADFFFTTCQTICPIMTDHMREIQKATITDNDILLLSHTVTPEIDTIEQLKRYANLKGVNASKWNLVTGDKRQIYDLARKSYLAVKDNDFGNYSMIHTENFILIDKEQQIRGFYDGTNTEEIERLLDDIKILKASYKD